MVFLQNNFRCPPIGSSKNLKDLKELRVLRGQPAAKGRQTVEEDSETDAAPPAKRLHGSEQGGKRARGDCTVGRVSLLATGTSYVSRTCHQDLAGSPLVHLGPSHDGAHPDGPSYG